MRILIIHNKYFHNAGGEDATVDAEVNLLRTKGHEVSFLLYVNSLPPDGVINKLTKAASVVYNKSSANILRERVTGFNPEVIHIHNFFYEASPSIIIEAHKCNVPVIVTIHNFRLVCANAILLRNNKVCELCVNLKFPWYGVKYRCYRDSASQSAMVGVMAAWHKVAGTWKKKVDQFITPSNFLKQRLIHSSLELPAEQVSTKRNFVEDPGFSDYSGRQDFYLFVGRLSEEKGLSVMLNAFRKFPGLRLVVAGGGPLETDLLKNYGDLTNIKFIGQQPKEQVIQHMKKCKALIFPSIWYEGLPVTLIEALAVGTPVIASRIGAMEEMLEENITGSFFTPGDTDDLAAKLLRFDKQEHTSEMNKNARQAYLASYHPEKCYQDVMKIYHEVLTRKKATNVT